MLSSWTERCKVARQIFSPPSRSKAPVKPFLIEGRGCYKTGNMKLTLLMLGVVLLLSQVHGSVTDCYDQLCTAGGDLKFRFYGDRGSNTLQMCLFLDNQNCEGCYKVVKKKCDEGYCWDIVSYKEAQKINTVVGIMGGLIAMMLVVMVSTVVLYIRASPIIFKKLQQKKEQDIYEKPIIPTRPSHTLKDEKLIQDCLANEGYVQGNSPKVFEVKTMEINKAFKGQVIA